MARKTRFLFLCLAILMSPTPSHLEATEENGVCDKDGCHDRSLEIGVIDETLNDLDQEDPRLIEAVRKRLVPPPPKTESYVLQTNFKKITKPTGGQYNQVEHLAELFKNQKNGYFIEAGAFDGEYLSNSLYFEKKLNWTGLLVEPNPDPFSQMLKKKRKSHSFGYCLSTKKTPEIVDFDACGLLGGIIHEGVRLADDKDFDMLEAYKKSVNQRTIQVQCFPLYTILMALGNPQVDFISLDIEGAEMPVLKTIPWDKVNIRALMIEVNHMGKVFEGSLQDLEKFLDDIGFKFYKTVKIDNIYIRKDFNAN